MNQIKAFCIRWALITIIVLFTLALSVMVGYGAYLVVEPQSALALLPSPGKVTSSLRFFSLDGAIFGRGNNGGSLFNGQAGNGFGGVEDPLSSLGADAGSLVEEGVPGDFDESDPENPAAEPELTALPTSTEIQATQLITSTVIRSETPLPYPSETLSEPTETAVAAPGPTDTPIPTDAPSPTNQPTPSPSSWHSPDTHEHGDAPPRWVLRSGLQPDFDAGERHEGYKAMLINASNARGWVGRQKVMYLIFHAFSFPPAMRVQFHSYQLWVLHSDNTVSWLQGAVDTGTYPEHRVDKCTDNRNKPDMRIPFLASGCISMETWYPRGRGIHPDIVRAMSGGFFFDPTDDLGDPSTWDETGLLGLIRLDTVIIRTDNDGLQRGGFCAHRNSGEIGPCDGSFLPQYISPTMFADCVENYGSCEVRGEAKKIFEGPNVELPN